MIFFGETISSPVSRRFYCIFYLVFFVEEYLFGRIVLIVEERNVSNSPLPEVKKGSIVEGIKMIL